MKTITKIFDVYYFPELSKEAQKIAIDNQIHWQMEYVDFKDQPLIIQQAIDDMKNRKDGWILGSRYIYDIIKDKCLDYIIKNMTDEKYLYYATGEMYNDNDY